MTVNMKIFFQMKVTGAFGKSVGKRRKEERKETHNIKWIFNIIKEYFVDRKLSIAIFLFICFAMLMKMSVHIVKSWNSTGSIHRSNSSFWTNNHSLAMIFCLILAKEKLSYPQKVICNRHDMLLKMSSLFKSITPSQVNFSTVVSLWELISSLTSI